MGARFLGLILLLPLAAHAEEGKWTPQQVLELDARELKRQGLELPVSRLWDPQRGTGLLAAAISIPGCSGAFVTQTGLFLSNHHCLFGVLQEHSTPQQDYITHGYVAHSQEEELKGRTMRLNVPRKFTDVTKLVEASVPAGATDLARYKAVEAKSKQLVAECEKTADARCNLASFDGGLQYVLVETMELTDIRLVYAPPREVGEFGGEEDNFRWPRHVGDFALGRAYKDGKPYKPEFFFPISRDGVKAGDFVMVLGYPARTFRALTAAEMSNERAFRFELSHDLYGEWIRLIEESTKGSAEGVIAKDAILKSLNNTNTNAMGQLAGLTRGRILEKQAASDTVVVEWAKTNPAYASALRAKQELDRIAEERRAGAQRDYLLGASASGALPLKHATTLVHLAVERQKPDAEREPGYQARDMDRLRNSLDRDQSAIYEPADRALLESWIARAQKAGVFSSVGPAQGMDAAALLRSTRVMGLKERLKMFEESPEQLRARKDPMLDLAFKLEPLLRDLDERANARAGAIERLRPEWRRAVIAQAGKPVAPDANSTLRVSFAHVKGYSPRDGVEYTPLSTVAGMIEKNTGKEPFAVPQEILAAAADGKSDRVPIDFLSNADTTGGNSGSPVVNGRGELVGLNFDRVWENVSNDFGYNPEVARNISVDIRFFVWLLHDVQHADGVLKELGL